MKKFLLIAAIVFTVAPSCRFMGKTIRGSGNVTSEERHPGSTTRIKLAGSYDVEITQGNTPSVKVEADDNLLPYIITEVSNGVLVVRSKDHVNISSENDIKIYITTAVLEEVSLTGSGNVTGKTRFTGGNKMTLKIAGSGDLKMELNAPELNAEIAGSGTMTLSGETKDESVHISGVGNYNADELKAESAKVRIAGSGDVKVFADQNLDINIAGVGSVYYKGAASVKQHIAGSGEVRKIN